MTERRGRGRPRGTGNTRAAVLAAARQAFSEKGYDGASLRAIGETAGVDPAMIRHFFGDKEALFREVVAFPVDPAEVVPRLLEGGLDGIGERIIRFFLTVWEGELGVSPFTALIRSVTTHEESATLVREFVTRQVLGRVAATLQLPDARLRVSLVGSQLVGLGMVRYVLRVEPLASADRDTVVAAVAPTIQRYLTGDIAGL